MSVRPKNVFILSLTTDTRTRDWLKKIIEPVFGHPQFVRFSWSTCAEMLKKHAKEVLW